METKEERHSPRGRISLMRAIADGELEVTKAFGEEMYYCLGCLACTSACPAGVNYAELFETARAEVEKTGVLDSPKRDAIRWFALRLIFTRPRLLRFVGRLLWVWRVSGAQTAFRKLGLTRLLPPNLRRLEPQAPAVQAKFSHQLIRPVERPSETDQHLTLNAQHLTLNDQAGMGGIPLNVQSSALSVKRSPMPLRRVAVLTGCVQDLVFADVNRATVDVLLANGCEVHTPPVQPCCGSLHAHNGDMESARELARRQLDLMDPATFDAIISNAGGCGSHLRHYDHLLADDPVYAARAAEWSRKLRDISEYLVEIGFRKPVAQGQRSTLNAQHLTLNEQTDPDALLSVKRSMLNVQRSPIAVTYHESCHLCHGQKVSKQPREILAAVPGVALSECAEATWCCGSAGIYNITQPETSAWLQERKLGHLRTTGAEVVATCNPGCHLQIENGFKAAGETKTVVHPIVLLARAYQSETRA
jgi:glycolate oxidase iron-sulfur subunit